MQAVELKAIEKTLLRMDAKLDAITVLTGTDITLHQFAKLVKRTPGTVRRWILEERWMFGEIPKFDKGGPNGGRWTCPVDRYLSWAMRERAIRK